MIVNPTDPWAWASLVGDVVDVAVPFVAGVGEAARVAKTTVHVVDTADDVVDAAKAVKKAASATSDIKKATGTYVILYKSGNTYVGKGEFSRAITSAKSHMIKNTDKVSALIRAPASTQDAAFIAESLLQSVRKAGKEGVETYNKIWSPGRNLVN